MGASEQEVTPRPSESRSEVSKPPTVFFLCLSTLGCVKSTEVSSDECAMVRVHVTLSVGHHL
jgi:hypothetical protein